MLTLPPSLQSIGKKHKVDDFVLGLAPLADAAVRIGGKTHLVDGERLTPIGDVDLVVLPRLAGKEKTGCAIYVRDGLECVKKRLGKIKVEPGDEIPSAMYRVEQHLPYFGVAFGDLPIVWETAEACGLAVTKGTSDPILAKREKRGKRGKRGKR